MLELWTCGMIWAMVQSRCCGLERFRKAHAVRSAIKIDKYNTAGTIAAWLRKLGEIGYWALQVRVQWCVWTTLNPCYRVLCSKSKSFCPQLIYLRSDTEGLEVALKFCCCQSRPSPLFIAHYMREALVRSGTGKYNFCQLPGMGPRHFIVHCLVQKHEHADMQTHTYLAQLHPLSCLAHMWLLMLGVLLLSLGPWYLGLAQVPHPCIA